MVSWFPIIMPEMYDRINPNNAFEQWDFSNYVPDVVVINLLQNDAFLMRKPEHAQFKARFGEHPPGADQIISAYTDFVKKIRGHYPNATIICALGSMDAVKDGEPWKGYVQQAVDHLKDPKTLTYFFPFNGTHRHPKKAEHQILADSLSAFIDRNVKW